MSALGGGGKPSIHFVSSSSMQLKQRQQTIKAVSLNEQPVWRSQTDDWQILITLLCINHTFIFRHKFCLQTRGCTLWKLWSVTHTHAHTQTHSHNMLAYKHKLLVSLSHFHTLVSLPPPHWSLSPHANVSAMDWQRSWCSRIKSARQPTLDRVLLAPIPTWKQKESCVWKSLFFLLSVSQSVS